MTTTMNISLPESLKDYVKERVTRDDFSNPSEYIRFLIREDKKRRAQEELEHLLLQGLDSGAAQTMSEEDWQEVRQQVHRKLAEKKHES